MRSVKLRSKTLQATPQETPNVSTQRRALVVDDEQIIADSLAAILRLRGFDTAAVYSGVDAVEWSRIQKPDLLITDVMMPGMNGIETAIAIREFLPLCKILLFSGQAATAELLGDAEVAGYHFEILSKPVHPNDLLVKIASAFQEN